MVFYSHLTLWSNTMTTPTSAKQGLAFTLRLMTGEDLPTIVDAINEWATLEEDVMESVALRSRRMVSQPS